MEDRQFDIAIPIFTASLKQAPQHVVRFLKVFGCYKLLNRPAETLGAESTLVTL